MSLSLKIKLGLLFIGLAFVVALPTSAATLDLALEKNISSAKEDIAVLVTINSEGQEVNTAQATIKFPSNLLTVTKIDRVDSVFSFWLTEPTYDNEGGTIRFVGGSTSGFAGTSLKVLRIAFRVKGSGTGRLSVSDGAITASDGSGSNVYNTSKGLDLNIPATAEFQAVQVERATRAAATAKELPALLGIEVPFYPDSSKWNNRSAAFQVKWKIAADTSSAAVALNQNPNFAPEASAAALTGHQIFPALADGVWYLHLRVANNIGWSPTLHYRLAIDSTPPKPFQISALDNLKTKNPQPTINFASSDLGSGIDHYLIHVDGLVVASTSQATYRFAPLSPGVHQVVVSAVDRAGNSTSQSTSLEVLPIASPVISAVSRQVVVNEEGISAAGTAAVGTSVLIQIQNAQKQIVAEQVAPIDAVGNWSVTIDKDLRSGDYRLLATARDKDLASSLPAVSETIEIRPRPVLVLGPLAISETWFFIILILLLAGSFGAGWLTYRRFRSQLSRRATVAQRDVLNMFDACEQDLDKLLKNCADGHLSDSDITEMNFLLKKMKDSLQKSRRYVIDNIRKIGD